MGIDMPQLIKKFKQTNLITNFETLCKLPVGTKVNKLCDGSVKQLRFLGRSPLNMQFAIFQHTSNVTQVETVHASNVDYKYYKVDTMFDHLMVERIMIDNFNNKYSDNTERIITEQLKEVEMKNLRKPVQVNDLDKSVINDVNHFDLRGYLENNGLENCTLKDMGIVSQNEWQIEAVDQDDDYLDTFKYDSKSEYLEDLLLLGLGIRIEPNNVIAESKSKVYRIGETLVKHEDLRITDHDVLQEFLLNELGMSNTFDDAIRQFMHEKMDCTDYGFQVSGDGDGLGLIVDIYELDGSTDAIFSEQFLFDDFVE